MLANPGCHCQVLSLYQSHGGGANRSAQGTRASAASLQRDCSRLSLCCGLKREPGGQDVLAGAARQQVGLKVGATTAPKAQPSAGIHRDKYIVRLLSIGNSSLGARLTPAVVALFRRRDGSQCHLPIGEEALRSDGARIGGEQGAHIQWLGEEVA